MKLASSIKLIAAFCSILCLMWSCSLVEDEKPVYTESTKNLDGTWKIVKAYRNDVDITGLMDFTKFRLSFQQDNTYKIENYLPFIVSKDGVWGLNDPQYPFRLSFKAEGAEAPLETTLSYPIVNGERQIGLTFSPGCRNNRYTYILEKTSTQ